MAAEEVNISVQINCINDDLQQYFPCLSSIGVKPICCTFVLKYLEEVELPENFEEDFNKDFKSYLNHGRSSRNNTGHNSASTQTPVENLRCALLYSIDYSNCRPALYCYLVAIILCGAFIATPLVETHMYVCI